MGLLISATGRAVALSVLLVCCATPNGFGQQSWSGGVSSVILPPSSSVSAVSGGIRHDLPATATAHRLARLSARAFVGEWSLRDFITLLNETGIPTVVNGRALEEEAVAEDDRIKISGRLPMDASLTQALRDLDLAWTVSQRGTHILITSRSDMEERLMIVTYDVTPSVATGESSALIHTLTSTVEPDSWDEVGGPGTAKAMGVRGRHLLVVSNAYLTQLKVSRLFNSLNRLGGASSVPLAGSRSRRGLMTASQPIALPTSPKKRGINLPNSGSMSAMGGGGFGGMF